VSTRARRSTTATTRCRSASPASSTGWRSKKVRSRGRSRRSSSSSGRRET